MSEHIILEISILALLRITWDLINQEVVHEKLATF